MASPARSLALLVIALCVISKDAAGRRLNLERAEPLVAPTAVTSDGTPRLHPPPCSSIRAQQLPMLRVQMHLTINHNNALDTSALHAGPAPEEINPIFERFRWAVKYIERTQELGVFPKWMCPDEAKVGARPKSHTPDVIVSGGGLGGRRAGGW